MNTIVLIVILFFLVAGFMLLKKFSKNTPAVEEHHDHAPVDGVCCGKHTVCDKGYESLYFDDEELDRFKGTGNIYRRGDRGVQTDTVHNENRRDRPLGTLSADTRH